MERKNMKKKSKVFVGVVMDKDLKSFLQKAADKAETSKSRFLVKILKEYSHVQI